MDYLETVVVIDKEGKLQAQVKSEPSIASELEGFIIVEWKWPSFDIYGNVLNEKNAKSTLLISEMGLTAYIYLNKKLKLRLSIKVNNQIYIRYID